MAEVTIDVLVHDYAAGADKLVKVTLSDDQIDAIVKQAAEQNRVVKKTDRK